MNATFVAVRVLHWVGALATQQAWPPGRQNPLSAALLAWRLGAGLLVLGLLTLPLARRVGVAAIVAGMVGVLLL